VENPNEYDEGRYNAASGTLTAAVEELWEAGADLSDIKGQVTNALKSAGAE
jgi:hypothetical protein